MFQHVLKTRKWTSEDAKTAFGQAVSTVTFKVDDDAVEIAECLGDLAKLLLRLRRERERNARQSSKVRTVNPIPVESFKSALERLDKIAVAMDITSIARWNCPSPEQRASHLSRPGGSKGIEARDLPRRSALPQDLLNNEIQNTSEPHGSIQK